MRKQTLKAMAVAAMGVGVLVCAKPAAAASATHGVVFIHGTGDYPVAGQTAVSTTALTCTTVSGNAGKSCYAPAAYGGSNYWEANEVSAVSAGRPFAVVGYNGGSCAPWAQTASSENLPDKTDGSWSKTSTAGTCPLATGVGNADIIAGQIQQFITANPGMNELAIVTHSGGSNQARYILNNYTRNTTFSTIRGMTKRVVVIAGTTDGTYLANELFSGAIPGADLVAGLVGYGGEGVNMLRTTNISTYNSSSSYLGAVSSSVGGVNFYSTGGVSTNVCIGAWVPAVTIWGITITPAFCAGVTGPTLGILPSGDHSDVYVTGNSCDSEIDDLALLALNDLFMNTNDSSTFRNSCSDGFISCQGSQALGNTFSYSGGQDHNQSRRECNGLQSNVANMVSGSASGFDYSAASFNVSPHQLDACGFGTYAYATNTNNQTIGWTEGCATSQLGNGNCDWDCVALYGNDAVVTAWEDSAHTIPLTWGTSDCTENIGTYNNVAYGVNTTVPFADNNPSVTSSGSATLTAFNGATCTGTTSQCGGNSTSTTWFTDPNWGDTETTTAKISGNSNGAGYFSAGFCPQSWVGDGTCDECVLALYGADGMDCAPGHITQCGGILTKSQPYQGSSYFHSNNAIYDEGLPTDSGGDWFLWQSMPSASNDGVCEETECVQGTAGATGMVSSTGYATAPTASGTACANSNQCPGTLLCSGGYCAPCTGNANNANGSCNSSTYGWSGGTCNTHNGNCYETSSIGAQCASNTDCLSGTCVNGGCSTQASDCTATYTASAVACTENNQCNGDFCIGGTCAVTGGTCSTDANCPGASGATSTCSSGFCSCTTTADCSNGATCNNPSGQTATGSCATSVSVSLCR